ncbi:sensor histidine kinase [Streptomyces flavofungini]|uniref:sensor histidine kinase n=1 Tax=Streptomyces flavofungini TaxID=68200 RepID=UPI0025AF0256|nr:sensor histidine kinase [Streptomyces flavofungini]WJV47201.1 sensor histidine kinase [Streptomyces flavofungini]
MNEARVPSRPGCAHQLLLYGDDAQFLSAALPFAHDGVTAGEPVFVATNRHNTALLRRRLGPRAGRVTFAAAHWFRSPAQALLSFHDKARTGGPGSRVLGEAPWNEFAPGQLREWSRYESLLTLALASTGARHLCPYNTAVLAPGILRTARLTHPTLAAGSSHLANPDHVAPAEFSAGCDAAPLSEPPMGSAEFHFAEPRQIAALREFAAWSARCAALSSGRVDSLLICVAEAATNVLRHGGGAGACRIWATAYELICEISDDGGDLDTALAGHLPPDPARPGGRGLWLIRRLSDAADIRSTGHGTTVRIRMTLDRRRATP